MELGVHLPLMRYGDEELSLQRLQVAVDSARDCGFAAVSANDHFVFQTPWLDGLTALASVIERRVRWRSRRLCRSQSCGVRFLWPRPWPRLMCSPRVGWSAVAPGSSERDYAILGIPFEERWKRFDEALALLRALLRGEPMPGRLQYYPVPPDVELAPRPWPRR